jgi:uncharacterized protein (TIGR02145 family)
MKQLNKIKAFKIVLFAFLLLASGITNAQIGIGIANPAASAQLDVSSTKKGFLPPRLTQAQRDAIANPAAGLMIWCKDCGIAGEIQVHNGIAWTNMVGANATSALPKSVTIGTQEWMTKNLDVVTYRNGDTIPQVKDAAEWANLTTGAWCYYNNDPATGTIFGKLYNRHAVMDSRGLAPAGWHIPDDEINAFFNWKDGEWRTLINNLGGEEVAAGKMKATTLWNSSNNEATNSSGFSALPGGYRDKDGSFDSIGITANWWGVRSFYEYDPHDIPSYGFYYNAWQLNSNFHSNYILGILTVIEYDIDGSSNATYHPTYNERMGFSVRCVKD